jgi:hypothetical protein
LHDTVEDTPYTLAALKRDFGTEIALMVTQIMALDRLGGQQEREVSQVMAMIRSADTRVVFGEALDTAFRLLDTPAPRWRSRPREARSWRWSRPTSGRQPPLTPSLEPSAQPPANRSPRKSPVTSTRAGSSFPHKQPDTSQRQSAGPAPSMRLMRPGG